MSTFVCLPGRQRESIYSAAHLTGKLPAHGSLYLGFPWSHTFLHTALLGFQFSGDSVSPAALWKGRGA